jgi:hypothetical protein
MCITEKACCGHGDFYENKCYCDTSWFDDCGSSLKDKWQEAFYTYVGVFMAGFFLMGIICLRALILKIYS